MNHELELNEANRQRLAEAFCENERVDCSIDCVLEGRMGHAFVDDADRPTAYRITTGPFWYFAGDARSPGGRQLLEEFPPYTFLMPSPPQWLEVTREIYGDRLQDFPRYSFSSEALSAEHLTKLLQDARFGEQVVPLDEALATRLTEDPEIHLDVEDFGSIQNFVAEGIGYTAIADEQMVGVAYSALICSTGLEVSIYVKEAYRERGVATALASKLLLASLQRGLRPNWDAANPESYKLAQKLGYRFRGTYDAYYYVPE